MEHRAGEQIDREQIGDEQVDAEQVDDERTWLTRRLFPDGTDPDARFTLANERTFLAWIRTSLALLGGGVALEAFALDIPAIVRTPAAIMLVVLALIITTSALVRWRRVENAMRHRRSLPAPGAAILLTIGMVVATCVLLGLFWQIGG